MTGFLELRFYYLRNGEAKQVSRSRRFLKDVYAPALQRAGTGPLGLFEAIVAADTPLLLAVAAYPSLGAMQVLESDVDYQASLRAYTAGQPPYVKIETMLLRCFPAVPGIDCDENGVFELRTYRSDTEATLRTKIGMFEKDEIAIFRQNGIRPVFFGEAVAGARLPHLTYMVGFANMAAREAAWKSFVADPAWIELKNRPGYSDDEIVANIDNMILKPLQ